MVDQLVAAPGVAADAVAATARIGISMFIGALGAVPEAPSPELGNIAVESRVQRAGSVGVVLNQSELTMGSDAMHEETLAAWRNMN